MSLGPSSAAVCHQIIPNLMTYQSRRLYLLLCDYLKLASHLPKEIVLFASMKPL